MHAVQSTRERERLRTWRTHTQNRFLRCDRRYHCVSDIGDDYPRRAVALLIAGDYPLCAAFPRTPSSASLVNTDATREQ